MTGSLVASKGLEELLQAVVQIGDRSLRVLIVGTFARNTDYYRRLVALPQQLTRATAAQVPGEVFEAMAMARPIVATAVSDLPEILEGCVVVVPPDSVDRLAEGLEWVLANPVEAEALGGEARRSCEDRYSWNAMECVLDSALARWEPPAGSGRGAAAG